MIQTFNKHQSTLSTIFSLFLPISSKERKKGSAEKKMWIYAWTCLYQEILQNFFLILTVNIWTKPKFLKQLFRLLKTSNACSIYKFSNLNMNSYEKPYNNSLPNEQDWNLDALAWKQIPSGFAWKQIPLMIFYSGEVSLEIHARFFCLKPWLMCIYFFSFLILYFYNTGIFVIQKSSHTPLFSNSSSFQLKVGQNQFLLFPSLHITLES